MIGVHVNKKKICPSCGGLLEDGKAAIPFLINKNVVVVVKNVPAEICLDCHEPFVIGKATDQILAILKHVKSLRSEVSIVTYSTTKQYAAA